MNRVVVGIDLGGTASRLVAYGADRVLSSGILSTDALGQGSVDVRLDRLANVIAEISPPDAGLAAVGIGASGPVDIQTGVIHNPYTLPCFSEIELVSELKRRLTVPIILENDAVAAAIAEQRIGAGANAERLLVVTLGTGIGVAFLLAGKPFRGPGNAHPEAGHIPIPSGHGGCYCGADRCWEQSASRKSLQQMLRPMFPAETRDAELLSNAAEKVGRPEIEKLFDQFGIAVGEGLAVLHSVYIPEVTVIAGSAAKYLRLYERAVQSRLRRVSGFSIDTLIRPTTLGDSAGAIGAALLASDTFIGIG